MDHCARLTMGALTLELIFGDITRQGGFDAIVNSAHASLEPGGGLSAIIHGAAGPGLANECAQIGPLEPGRAIATRGYRLPNRHVIHAVAPNYRTDPDPSTTLARVYYSCLKVADELRLESIAFPALSCGLFGYPSAEAATIAVDAIGAARSKLRCVARVRWVLASSAIFDAFSAALDREQMRKAEILVWPAATARCALRDQ